MTQQTLSVSNDVAAELAGIGDGVLDSLRDRLNITIRMRGNQLTLEGEEQEVEQARVVVDELVELVEGGHEIGPSTIDAVVGALDEADYKRTVDTLLGGGSDPVITKEPEGAFTHVVTDKAAM